MKKIMSFILAVTMGFCLFGCGDPKPNTGEITKLTVLSEKSAAIYFVQGDEDSATYALKIDYPDTYAAKDIGIKPGYAAIASFKAVSNKEYMVTPKKEGVFTVELSYKGTLEETVTINFMNKYPVNPDFNALQARPNDYTSWTEFGAHDPSLIEAEGKYYAFSTDVSGTRSGYQIRESSDLTHWSYLQTAIHTDDMKAEDYLAGNGSFQEAFNWSKVTPDSTGKYKGNDVVANGKTGQFSFWAPDVVKGKDGKYWLYFSLTGFFGGSKSCIGLAKADAVTGPYAFDSVIIKSAEGWGTPNCIDAQIIFEENDSTKPMWMVYGSFGKGIHMIRLDNETGRRLEEVPYTGTYTLTDNADPYYGTKIAGGNMEGPVVGYAKDVNGTGYYYLMTSYGSLTSSYNMRSARSESITGPYTDSNGKELSCNTSDWSKSTGDKVMGSFAWDGYDVDWNAPGHNDMATLSNGVNLVVYHCRTYYFENAGMGSGNNFHFLYLGQYALNADGRMVINPNRYAGERLRKVDATELTTKALSGGKYQMVRLKNDTVESQKSALVTLSEDGKVTGASTGTWQLSGDNFITLTLDEVTYKGVVMPAWLQSENKGGLTITALSDTGMSLYMNMRF